MQCPRCQHANPPGAKFCLECGGRLTLACAQCGVQPLPGAKFCSKCGAGIGGPQPPSPDLHSEGERRQLTVLFCDLVGSTPLSQQLDAEDWRDVIARYQQAASGAVTRFGGYVAKSLGDGLLIYFGWPTACEDDPERAVRAGLAIIEQVSGLGSQVSGPNTQPPTPNTRLSVRVGLHTGPVVIADGGEVFGETVNIAARVQTAANPDTVAITEATQRLVAGRFVVEDRGPQRLRGVREPVTLYRVVRPSGVRSRLEVAAGRLTRFVGREIELATLVDRWERAQDGAGQCVLVLGEAGIGKSRLVYQLREHVAATPHTWLECGASPYTEGTPFRPVIALASQGLGFAPEDTTAEQLGKLERGLGTLASTETTALLADFVGLPPPTPRQFGPQLQRRKTVDLLVQWTLSLGAAQPLVVCVEDLHWCDVSTLELLGYMIRQSPTARILLLATARPEFSPPWPVQSNLTTVHLARLTQRQVRNMVTALAGPALSAETIDALTARADGVPLYIEELAKTAMESGAVGGVRTIPATLADSLMARLDRLSTAKEIAQRAAVLGREFGYALLAATAGVNEAALHDGLARLVGAEILFVRGEPPASTYTFKHALLQEATYGSLLKRMRQQLHSRVVDVLVDQFPERTVAEPEVVAQHAEAAGRRDEAITHYHRAGEQAQGRSAHGEAIRHFRKALTLLGEPSEHAGRELELQLALAPSLAAARGYAHRETEAAYERAWELASTGSRAEQMSALVGLGNVYLNSGRFAPALQLVDRALAIADALPDDWHRIAAYRATVMIAYFQGRFRVAREYAERVATAYDASRHHRPVVALIGDDPGVVARCFLAWALWALGFPNQANAHVQSAIRASDALGHPFSAALARFFAGAVHWMCRNLSAQRHLAEELMQVAAAQGFPFWLGLATALRGHAVYDAPEVSTGMAVAAATGNQAAGPLLYALVAEAHHAHHQYAEADAAVDAGLTVSAKTGQPFFDAELHRLRGEIALKTAGDRGASLESQRTAEACFRRALEIAHEQEARSLELRAANSLAALWRDQGKWADARELLAPLYAWFTEGFDTGDLIEAKRLLEALP